jgi:hypothetical protein
VFIVSSQFDLQNLEAILSYMDAIYTDEHGEWPYGDFNVDATQRPQQKRCGIVCCGKTLKISPLAIIV